MVMGSRRLWIYAAGTMAAAGLVMGASPWALGWPPANERQTVLRTALLGARPSRSAIKLVPASDLPASLAWGSGAQLQGNVWVVAQSLHLQGFDGVMGSPSATWMVQVFPEDVELQVGGTAGTSGSWPPFFDRLPDRSPPPWWPIPVPTPEVAAQLSLVIVFLIAVAIVAALIRGIRFAVSRGVRRLGRPT
jgi:hypothetical protein